MRYGTSSKTAPIVPTVLAAMAFALTACGASAPETTLSPSAQAGLNVAQRLGCVACHGVEGQGLDGLGPSWQGLYDTEVTLVDGTTARVDLDYLRRSILEPEADLVAGFTLVMPPYKPEPLELEAVLAYLVEAK